MEESISEIQLTNARLEREVEYRKRAEDSLRESAKNFRNLVNQNLDGIVIVDKTGIVCFVNPQAEKLFDTKADYMIDSPFGYQLDKDSPAEIEITRKNGEYRTVELRVVETVWKSEVHYLVVLRDITTRKRYEKELKEAKEASDASNRTKSEFLAAMSHEIRTPMNTIMGMTNVILDSDLTEEQKNNLMIIRDSGNALMRIIDDILDLSKIEAGKFELIEEEFNLMALVEAVIQMFQFESASKDNKMEYHLDSNIPVSLFGDGGRLRQALTNLLSNAVKYTANGTITLNISLHASLPEEPGAAFPILFQVKDSGCGISVECRKSIFEAYTRADGDMIRQYGGTGLGLTITKRIVEMMGGEIWVESDLGKGSTFSFTGYFRKSAQQNPPSDSFAGQGKEKLHTPGVTPEKRAGRRILLAEDDPMNLDMAKKLLKKIGYQSEEARNGEEAIRKLSSGHFDLVLMDVQMPDMDGFEATRIIRDPLSAVKNHQIPIVAMTASAMKGDREKCLEKGMNDYISKPVELEELAKIIDTLLFGSKS